MHHLVLQDGMEFLELVGYMCLGFQLHVTMVPLKDEYVHKLIFLHGFKP
jgi:hypothetical protein